MEDVSPAAQNPPASSPSTASQWHETLFDRALRAKDVDERIAISELFRTALEKEPGDTSLWKLSADWTWILYKTYNKVQDVYDNCAFGDEEVQPLGDDDLLLGASLFQWDLVVVAWKQAADAVRFHLNDSNTVWDPYVELLLYDLSASPSPEKVAALNETFIGRLHQPQPTWDNTFQAYSQFISKYDEANWEKVMVDIRSQTATVRKAYEDREGYERALAKAAREHDTTTELQTLRDYLVLEEDQTQQKKKKNKATFADELFITLCERATSRFPSELDLWQDYVVFLMQDPLQPGPLLSVAQRATAHCPTSGLLWQYRIYAAEAVQMSHDEVHAIKNEATFSGTLVDQGRFEEQIKVDYAWCSFLRRRAFRPDATSDDRDICEMAIRSAIDEMMAEGKRMHGSAFAGDPEFRLERIYLRFWAQCGKLDAGRKLFRELEATYGHLAHFWERWYLWEMTVYSTPFDLEIQADFEPLGTPSNATAVYERALNRAPLNTYDECMELVKKYLHHCGQHETIYKLLQAIVTSRRYSKKAGQLLQEYYAQVEAQNAAAGQQAHGTGAPQESGSGSKRKLDKVDNNNGDQAMADVSKRHHHDPENRDETPATNSPPSHPARATRDRENTTIMVHHLPPSANEESIRRFFRDCGRILSLNVSDGDGQGEGEKTAHIEFASDADVLTAKTKDKKVFEDHEIDVQVGANTTLFVTNYPPTADEKWLRDLFEPYGTIVQIRFPSLKFQAGRRFCYVQFRTVTEAQAAAELDDKALPGHLKLIVKISNPAIKKKIKSGAAFENREVFVMNINWSINENELKQMFTPFGNVVSVRIPRKISGGSKGIGFVVYETPSQANEALAMNNREDRGRILQVSLSDPLATGARRKKGSALVHNEAAQERDSRNLGRPIRRTLTLLNVADTVSADRIDALCAEFGEIIRVKLRPAHAGATVEYADPAAVQRAKSGLAGYVLDGRELNFGSQHDLWAQVPIDKSSAPTGPNTSTQASVLPGQNLHPTHNRGRGGSRLGSNFGLHQRATAQRPAQAAAEDGGNESSSSFKPKTQDDFRAMLLGKKPETKAPDATGDTPMDDVNGN